jgi:hypothetical protein
MIIFCRFGQTDEKLWVTHLGFLKRLDWKAEAGKVLRRFLQTFTHKEEPWIFASRFEGQQRSELARTLLLEGLRFHPNSQVLYRELFILELEFALKLKQDPSLAQTETETDIVKVVFLKAIEAIDDERFMAELLGLAAKVDLEVDLKKSLIQEHGDKTSTWLTLANLELYPNKKARNSDEKIEDFAKVMDQGLDKLKSETFLRDYLDILRQIGQNQPESEDKVAELAFNVVEKHSDILGPELTEQLLK